MRRTLSCLAGALLAAAAIFNTCFAADWRPAKNVELIAGSTAGGALDRTAREIQALMQNQRLIDVAAVVMNRPGAGSAIAWTYLNRHPGDGHYLAVIIPGLLTNSITGASTLTYQDITPIAVLSSEYVIFAVNSASPIKSGRELVNALQADPARLNIGIATALGGASHIAVAQAMKAAGVNVQKLNFIVYPSSSEAVTALLGSHIDLVAASVGNFLPALQMNRLRPLAITSRERLGGVLKDIPTWNEQGISMVFASWRGIAGPKDMTRDQIAYWDGIFRKVVETSDWKRSLEGEFVQSTYLNSEQAKAFLHEQYKTLRAVLMDLQISK